MDIVQALTAAKVLIELVTSVRDLYEKNPDLVDNGLALVLAFLIVGVLSGIIR